ncbi:threonylcarbamoyl-AMP synthase [Candidatus Woesebacteria bacterium]|nr:threonylcarbamoyl-AMP synthase [Candidatus Woesebacteria bacterium]
MKRLVLGSNWSDVISETMQVLSQGGLVVFPSDTVYGLLVDATQEHAVQKLIAFKNRTPGKAISVFVTDIDMMKCLAHVPHDKEKILERMLPGPFTVVLDSKHLASQLLESEKGTIGLRLPAYGPVQMLMNRYSHPVTATSANLGGRHPNYSIISLMNQLPVSKKELIDLVVDAGNLPHHKPSTVLDLSQDTIQVLRSGDIIFENEDTFQSHSASQTRKLGAFILDRALKANSGKPLVFILKGDLGAGKTEITRGIASVLGIEKVVSPTFVISYEYPIPTTSYQLPTSNYNLFVHCDLYNIEDPAEFKHLGLTDYLDKKSIMVIEWGERMGAMYETFKEKSDVIFIEIEHVNEGERKIEVRG